MNRFVNRLIVVLSVVMLWQSAAFSQQVTGVSFTDSFTSYSRKAVQEKLFLHTDKEFYLSGEILWFKIYYIDGTSHRPGALSKVAYTEVINDKGQQVLQGKISLAHDENSGSFYLPATLKTGYYTVRAYTSWMRNFDSTSFFEKRIAILNTLKTPEPISPVTTYPVTIDFFPEGGNLVNGIESKLGFMVKKAGAGISSYKGYIVDKNNDTVSTFEPLKFGMGHFNFKPVSGNTYQAIIALSDTSIIKPLPDIFDYGYGISVTENNNDQISVAVYRKKMPGEAGNVRILLAVHTKQVLEFAENAGIGDNESVNFLIDKKKLAKGVAQITLFNEQGSPLCERLFYNPPANVISLQTKTDRSLYQKRQEVELGISAQRTTGKQEPLDLSASVFYLDSLQSIDESTIINYMWLASDLSGTVESPAYYFSDDGDVKAATDNLMLTQGWRKFNWENIWKGGNSFIKYLPDLNGQMITGVVRRKSDNKPVAGINASLSITGHVYGFYISQSDKQGIVRFEVKDYYGNKEVIPQVMSGDSLWLEVIKPYLVPSVPDYFRYAVTEDKKEQILKRSIAMQAQNVFLADSLRNFNEPYVSDTLPFFGKGEAVYMLDDYRRFPTMEEVLREYVMEIGVGVRGGKPAIKIFNKYASDFYTNDPLLLLDGVPISNVNKIFQYNPLNVKKLEVIRSRYVIGPGAFDGVVSFTTYDGVFDGFELDPRLVTIDYPGLQLQREFYSPVYSNKEQIEGRLPDFRNTLLWSPFITTSVDGKASIRFYSSDLAGRYVVVVQGMSASGEFVYTTSSFEVR
jgi:hypothetical protein